MEHIRHCLLYEYQPGHWASEAHSNICSAIGPNVISQSTEYWWFSRFVLKDYWLRDEARSRRPVEVNSVELKSAIEHDPTTTVRKMGESLSFSLSTVQHHFKKLNLSPKLGELKPYELSPRQKMRRVECCENLLSMRRNKPWLNNLITCDEKWVLYSNIKKKHQP